MWAALAVATLAAAMGLGLLSGLDTAALALRQGDASVCLLLRACAAGSLSVASVTLDGDECVGVPIAELCTHHLVELG